MIDTTERDARLRQIVADVKARWEAGKETKLPWRAVKQPKAPRPSKITAEQPPPPDELLPLIEAKQITKEKLRAKYKKCTVCGSKDKLTVEHIVPVAVLKLFGIRRMESFNYDKHKKNLTILCQSCNTKKGSTVDLSDKKVKRILTWYIKNHENL